MIKHPVNHCRRQRTLVISCIVSSVLILAILNAFGTHESLRASFKSTLVEQGSHQQRTSRDPGATIPPQKRRIIFLHVGKSGGTTMSRQIRRACKGRECARRQKSFEVRNETEISLQTIRYYHGEGSPDVAVMDEDNFTSFLVCLRNPVDRFISWYIQVHPYNDEYTDLDARGQMIPFFRYCYDNLDDFATLGLANTAVTGNDTNCTEFAKDIMAATLPKWILSHMYFNLHFYVRNTVLNEKYQDKEVFVVRVENQLQDWQGLNWMLGGGDVVPLEPVTHLVKKGTLPYNNKTISPAGIINLCCALKNEIATYEKVLYKANNLDDTEKKSSMDAVKERCNVSKVDDLCRYY